MISYHLKELAEEIGTFIVKLFVHIVLLPFACVTIPSIALSYKIFGQATIINKKHLDNNGAIFIKSQIMAVVTGFFLIAFSGYAFRQSSDLIDLSREKERIEFESKDKNRVLTPWIRETDLNIAYEEAMIQKIDQSMGSIKILLSAATGLIICLMLFNILENEKEDS